MKKIIALVLCLMLALCCFSACGTNDEDTLIVYLESGFPPFEYPDGENIVGVDVDIANAIGEKLGMKVVIKDVSFDSICAGISENNACGISGITINDERKENVDFTSPYYYSQQAIIYKKGTLTPNSNGVISTDVMVGKTIGVQTGTTGDFLVQDVCGEEGAKGYYNALIATQDIGTGCDFVVIDNVVAKNIVANNEGLECADLDVDEEPLGIAVKKGNTELLNKIEAVLQELIKEGKIEEYMIKHAEKAN